MTARKVQSRVTTFLRDAAQERDRVRRDSPASNEVLLQVWHAWHRLPRDLSPDERRDLLDGHPALEKRHPEWCRILRHCAGFPFSGAGYNSLLVAWRWMRAREQLTTLSRRQTARDRLDRADRLQRLDDVLLGAIGMVRAQRELLAREPGYFRQRSPSLDHILHWEERRRAYEAARQDAQQRLLAALSDSDDQADGPKSSAAPRRIILAGDSEPEDPELIARLEALGICPPMALYRFLARRLPFLPSEARQRYYRSATLARYGKDRLLPLQVWLADNAPVITRFRLRPVELLDAARSRGIPVCSSPTQLAKLRSRWNLPFRFGQGVPPPEVTRAYPVGLDLLSPPPDFTLFFGDSSSRKQ